MKAKNKNCLVTFTFVNPDRQVGLLTVAMTTDEYAKNRVLWEAGASAELIPDWIGDNLDRIALQKNVLWFHEPDDDILMYASDVEACTEIPPGMICSPALLS